MSQVPAQLANQFSTYIGQQGRLHWLMTNEAEQEAKERLGLDENASGLCISTEGDTSPELYKDIMWPCKNSL